MLLQIDGTLIVIAVSFILFIFIMQKIFYSPVSRIIDERNGYINSNTSSAQQTMEKSRHLLAEYEAGIAKARAKATGIVSKLTFEANKERSAKIEESAKKAANQINKEKDSVQNDKRIAIESLKPEIASLAHSISTRILGEEVPLSGITPEMIDKILNRK